MTKHNKEKKRARLAQLNEENGRSVHDPSVAEPQGLSTDLNKPKPKPKVKKKREGSWLKVFFLTIKAIFVKPKTDQRGKKRAEPKPPGRIKKLIFFFQDARKELHWVTWPTRKETIKSTGVLLVLVGISALYLGIVDGILTRLLGLLVN